MPAHFGVPVFVFHMILKTTPPGELLNDLREWFDAHKQEIYINRGTDMEVKDFQFKKGGTGICPKCGGETKAVGHDWTCESCGLKLNGPIF